MWLGVLSTVSIKDILNLAMKGWPQEVRGGGSFGLIDQISSFGVTKREQKSPS
jgi:hypothetical protein